MFVAVHHGCHSGQRRLKRPGNVQIELTLRLSLAKKADFEGLQVKFDTGLGSMACPARLGDH